MLASAALASDILEKLAPVTGRRTTAASRADLSMEASPIALFRRLRCFSPACYPARVLE
jgi:hypothetical protein